MRQDDNEYISLLNGNRLLMTSAGYRSTFTLMSSDFTSGMSKYVKARVKGRNN